MLFDIFYLYIQYKLTLYGKRLTLNRTIMFRSLYEK